ncbi:MAG TPA: peptidase C1 [Thiolapillus brandeum]|uniref:Peptidase C1 n=1 Tax=Thiolapillus brandeum TaxID=1076588 RepID=A0A831NT10_9GAMM|nr:peptidase C1 [Thiolapillus brandeum]
MPKTKWKKNASADVPDLRDWMYEPALIQLKKQLPPPRDQKILNQRSEGACTGFALAAAINLLYSKSNEDIRVSPRMLYEMAKRHDEWPGEDYDGSSLRGAIKGWSNMGVCRDELWPYRVSRKGDLTVRRAKEARNHTLGAYYRLRPQISHYHAALNEAGVIVVSAMAHAGWDNPENGRIRKQDELDGGHAFAVVGYDAEGFWVQNSWTAEWGDNGLALWTYEDWIENVMDAWVFRLALPTPSIFGLRPASSKLPEKEQATAKVPRSVIAGHFVHVDDDAYKESGRYWSTAFDVLETAKLVAESEKYDHLLLYVHGGLNSPVASAQRVAAMRKVFKQNRVYPFHVMYDTGLAEELKDVVLRKAEQTVGRVGGILDWADRFMEGLLRAPGTLLWEEMKRGACGAFATDGAATDAFGLFLRQFKKQGKSMKLHLVGHSTGAIAIGQLLRTLSRRQLQFETCSLMAPACTLDWYEQSYVPVLDAQGRLRIKDMAIYNLLDELEQDDTVTPLYHKSLLYLVSNAFERQKERPLLGMQKFADEVTRVGELPRIHYSNGATGKITRSTVHGGFDNDVYTMNHILKRVLDAAPLRPFKSEDLFY